MGNYAHLLHRPSGLFAALRTRELLEAKNMLPTGWFLFFARDDLRDGPRGPVLAADAVEAVGRARARASAIEAWAAPSLRALMQGLIDHVAHAGKGTLTLDPEELRLLYDDHDELRAELRSEVARF